MGVLPLAQGSFLLTRTFPESSLPKAIQNPFSSCDRICVHQ